MQTIIRKVDENCIDEMIMKEAGALLKQGALVAFPTETVYGLGANALDSEAAAKIYAAKGRPSDNPLIVHIADMDALPLITAEIPEAAKKLAAKFWPGPLTMVMKKSEVVPYGTTGGLDTVAVRMPAHPIALEMIRHGGGYIAAPSANTSGRPSPTLAEHVYQDMNGRIEMILDGGAVGIGVESTIVDVSGPVPMMLRPGAITIEMLRETVGEVEIDPAILGPMSADVKPKAPGMKYRHYAPKAELILVEAAKACQGVMSDAVVDAINQLVQEKLAQGLKVGVICTDETIGRYPQGIVRSLGLRAKEETIAHNLFAVLREFDDLQVDFIYSESFPKDHLGQAIMNRLTKAAGYHIVDVE